VPEVREVAEQKDHALHRQERAPEPPPDTALEWIDRSDPAEQQQGEDSKDGESQVELAADVERTHQLGSRPHTGVLGKDTEEDRPQRREEHQLGKDYCHR
jgi:hypothetical protein